MTQDTPRKSEDEPTVEPKATDAANPAELSDQDLDRAGGGGWPYLTNGYTIGGLQGG